MERSPQTSAPASGRPADLIYSYSRSNAIEDGILVDMTHGDFGDVLRQAGFHCHTAMTATAFEAAIGTTANPEGDESVGRWWEVVSAMSSSIAQFAKNPALLHLDRFPFTASGGKGKAKDPVRLYAHYGPGDDSRFVLTIMLEGED